MSGLSTLLAMSAFLGIGCFGVALLPLSFNFSKARIIQLSNFGTGLLLGAALGVILPEGLESMVAESNSLSEGVPTSSIAMSLLSGFTFMLVVEQFIGGHTHHTESSARSGRNVNNNSYSLNPVPPTSPINDPELEFDLHLANTSPSGDYSQNAYPLTLGLAVHALADGFALGAAALAAPDSGSGVGGTSEISLVVFFALLVHKAPASLALTTSLLATSLSRSEIRKHLAVFASSTPIGAVTTYFLLQLLGSESSNGSWTGRALLFSAGTFLYVATVLQPVSSASSASSDMPSKPLRLGIIVVGMFVPHAISLLVEGYSHGHGHGHGNTSEDRGAKLFVK